MAALIEQTEIVKLLKDAIAALELSATSEQKLLHTKSIDKDYEYAIGMLNNKLRVEEVYLIRAKAINK
jgi:hypothetical protein